MENILSIITIVFFALLVIMKINAKKASRNVLPELKERDRKLTFRVSMYHDSNKFMLQPRTHYYSKDTYPKEQADIIIVGTEDKYYREFSASLYNTLLAESKDICSCDLDDFAAQCDAQFKRWADEVKVQGLDKKEEK